MSYRDHKVIVVTPAGRRRYMEVLERYVGNAAFVDRWDVWLNTINADDVDYLARLAARNPFVRLVQAGDAAQGTQNIHNFFPHATDDATIYVRLDDDIVYLAPDFFPTLLDCRLANPHVLLVSANVVNNAICDHLHQRAGVLGRRHGTVSYRCLCPIGWSSPEHAEYVHRAFFESLRRDEGNRWRIQDWLLYEAKRFSINAISFFGSTMAKICEAGGVGEDEEQWLTVSGPRDLRLDNLICGDAIAAHFAFHPQREHLDQTNLLAEYRKLAGLTSQNM